MHKVACQASGRTRWNQPVAAVQVSLDQTIIEAERENGLPEVCAPWLLEGRFIWQDPGEKGNILPIESSDHVDWLFHWFLSQKNMFPCAPSGPPTPFLWPCGRLGSTIGLTDLVWSFLVDLGPFSDPRIRRCFPQHSTDAYRYMPNQINDGGSTAIAASVFALDTPRAGSTRLVKLVFSRPDCGGAAKGSAFPRFES